MNKNKLIITFFLIFLIVISSSLSIGINIKESKKALHSNEYFPKEAWNKTYGGTALDWGWCVQGTSDGGLIIAGETVSFGSGGYDAWLIKTDINGNETWNKTFGGYAKDGGRSVIQTNDDGFIIGGYVDSYGFPGHDVWLIKTDDNGLEEWNSIFGGILSDAAFSIQQTSDGGYVALGYVDSYGAGNHDIWLIKTDMNGYEEWNKTYGTSEWEIGYSAQQTIDDGFIIIGTTESYGSGGQDAWLIKTDAHGNEQWNKTFGGKNNDWGSAVVITDDGGYLLTGDTLSYGPGGYDLWLVKTDNYGNEQWKRVYGDSSSDDTGYSIKKTSDGGYIVTGTKTSFGSGLSDVWLIKTDGEGIIQWNFTFDGGIDDWAYSVDETLDGGYIITGLTNSYGAGDYDLLLIKVVLDNNENQPPTIPEISGPQFGEIEVDNEYFFVSEDLEGDEILYLVDWDDGNISGWLGPFKSGETIQIFHEWLEPGIYEIRAKAKDTYELESDWSDPYTVFIGNQQPNPPIINGPINGKIGTTYDYNFSSIDPDGDDIAYYLILWDDDTNSNITGPFLSGETINASHKWTKKGTYKILARATDIFGKNSYWGELTVTMPRQKVTSSLIFLRFLERFQLLNLLLQRLTIL